jgi:hypothetical protein
VVCTVTDLGTPGFIQDIVVITITYTIDQVTNLDEAFDLIDVFFRTSGDMNKIGGTRHHRNVFIGIPFGDKQTMAVVKI